MTDIPSFVRAALGYDDSLFIASVPLDPSIAILREPKSIVASHDDRLRCLILTRLACAHLMVGETGKSETFERQAAVLARRLDDRFAYRFMVPQPIGSPQEVQGRLADLDELIELSHGYGSSPSSARGSLPGLSSSFGFRLENPTGGLRSPRGAAVVITRHPKQARVVSAEFGERGRAGNGIRHVIVTAVGMRDGVPANRAGATLKPYNLA